jgi:toxin ParE1/3/4
VTPARFHVAALDEIEAELARYSEINPMLGEALLNSIEKALQLAREFPEMGSPYKYGTRRVFPKRFPFSLVYLHRDGEVYVVALAPFRRKPAYWKSRRNEG